MRTFVLALALALALSWALPVLAQKVAPPAGMQPVPYDKPQGIYATINVRSMDAQMRALGQLIPVPRREAIAAASNRLEALPPPVIYALANAVAQDDKRIADAVFYYHVGRLRAVYDGLRCKDPSAREAIIVLGRNLNPDISRYQRQNREQTLQIADYAIRWDREHKHDYDHRWINLYGKVAQFSPGTDPSELSEPESEWPKILERVHAAHLKSVQEFAAQK